MHTTFLKSLKLPQLGFNIVVQNRKNIFNSSFILLKSKQQVTPKLCSTLALQPNHGEKRATNFSGFSFINNYNISNISLAKCYLSSTAVLKNDNTIDKNKWVNEEFYLSYKNEPHKWTTKIIGQPETTINKDLIDIGKVVALCKEPSSYAKGADWFQELYDADVTTAFGQLTNNMMFMASYSAGIGKMNIASCWSKLIDSLQVVELHACLDSIQNLNGLDMPNIRRLYKLGGDDYFDILGLRKIVKNKLAYY
jgi:hypothetical protein